MYINKILVLIFLFCEAKSSTHWVVTEDGKIKQQLESPFAMKQPDDLVAFIRQERAYTHLQNIKETLLQEQADIDKNEDKDLQLESRHYRQDPDCRAAGKRLPDFDLFITSVLPLEHKEIQISDHINLSEVSSSDVQEPNCTNFYELPFSVHAYDHLEGVQNRHLFPLHPVSGLKSSMSFLKDEDAAATATFEALKKNSTSWVLYNLAAFYWRMKGNLNEAVECLRRALHFSPENYKDVALVSLANILHSARCFDLLCLISAVDNHKPTWQKGIVSTNVVCDRYHKRKNIRFGFIDFKRLSVTNCTDVADRVHFTLNATVLMHHALKISDEYSINHFTLANMYAALGQYNVSMHYYEETLKRQEDFETAQKELAAVKCQLKLQEKLEKQHLSLQRTLKELQEYKVKHDNFAKEQENFASLHISSRTLAEQHMIYEQRRLKDGTFNSKCHLRNNKSGRMIVCNLPTNEPSPPMLDENFDLYFEDPSPAKMTSMKEKDTESESVAPRRRTKKKPKKAANSTTEENELQQVESKSASNSSSNTTFTGFYDWSDPSWPPPGSCEKYAGKNPVWDDFPSAYVDPESRGFKVRELITTDLELVDEEMHPQPWNPPECGNLEEMGETPYDHFVRLESMTPRLKRDTFLQNYLYTHVNKGYVWPKDLGQRILTALQRAVKENDNTKKWILYNLAGLYWRVDGDNEKAIDCLRRSVHFAPPNHADIPLVSMSNIMYRMGKINNSVDLLVFALKVNNSEPASYLSMGNSLQARNNITGAIQFYNYATILNPQYQEAIQSLLIVKCQNRTRQNATKDPEEIIARWKADVAKIDKEKIEKMNEKLKYENKEDRLKETPTAEVDPERLVEAKEDIDKWLLKTDSLITELQTVSGEKLAERLNTAKMLIDKLSEVRTSLGHLVGETTSLDGKATSEAPCDEMISKADLSFASNTSFLSNFKIVINDVVASDGEPPTCARPSTPVLDDVTWANNIKKGPEEEVFTEMLKSLLQTSDPAKSLRSALLSDPNSWNYLIVTSFFWRITGNSQQVVECLLSSLAHAPNDRYDVTLYLISDYLGVLALYEEAANVAMKMKPSKQASHLLVKIHVAKGDYEKALDLFKEIMDVDSNDKDDPLRYQALSCLVQTHRP